MGACGAEGASGLVLSVTALMAAMMVATALPAFAAPSPNANCIGGLANFGNQLGRLFDEPGSGGREVAGVAQQAGGVGGTASTNCEF